MVKYKRIKYTDHADWLAKRKTGIGGSDISAVVNLNPFVGSYKLWLEKTGQAPEENIESERMFWGKRNEATIADVFAEKHTDLRVVKCSDILQHPTEDFAIYNPDRLLYKDGELGILEIKTSGSYHKNYTEHTYPDAPYLQVLWGMYVTGATFGWLCALINGNQYFEYYIERNDSIIETLAQSAREFWNNYIIPYFDDFTVAEEPPADGSQNATDTLSSVYPQAQEGLSLELEGLTDLVKSLVGAKNELKEMEAYCSKLENRIKQLLGNAETGFSEKALVNWKNYQKEVFAAKELQVDNPELYNKYLRTKPYRAMYVKLLEE